MTEYPAMQVVKSLRKYGEVPIDFLARSLGRRRYEVLADLEALKKEGFVTFRDDKVRLNEPVRAQGRPGAS
jgi:predicted transcriptional regulator